jgi:translation elongation factor P/translation initiation factor 5A
MVDCDYSAFCRKYPRESCVTFRYTRLAFILDAQAPEDDKGILCFKWDGEEEKYTIEHSLYSVVLGSYFINNITIRNIDQIISKLGKIMDTNLITFFTGNNKSGPIVYEKIMWIHDNTKNAILLQKIGNNYYLLNQNEYVNAWIKCDAIREKQTVLVEKYKKTHASSSNEEKLKIVMDLQNSIDKANELNLPNHPLCECVKYNFFDDPTHIIPTNLNSNYLQLNDQIGI